MSINPGGIQNILFRAVGTNPAIPRLHEKLSGTLDGEPVNVGDLRFGEPSKQAFISLEIVTGTEDKRKALAQLKGWLVKHARVLRRADAEKWIEVNTYMLPNQAYEQMGFSIDVMEAAVAAGCHLDITCFALFAPRDSMHHRLLTTGEDVKRPTGRSRQPPKAGA